MSTTTAQTRKPIERNLWLALLLMAVVAVVWFVVIAGQRILYPWELEWMEGALVDHAARVANGEAIYCAPTPEHVPFLYAPLLFWLGGGLMAFGIPGLLALRLIAVGASLGVALLAGHWVKKETGQLIPGLVASGLFLAGYGWLFWWFDLARNDSPFLLAMLACAYVLRHGGRRGWILAAALAVVAVLAKQSAVMWLPAIGVGALIHDWRSGVKFGLAGVAGILAALGILHWTSDGWSTFYLFEMPSHHDIVGENKLGFWTRDLWPMSPLVVLAVVGLVAACRQGRAREALFLAAVGSGGLMTSWFSRMHVGGFDNVLIYGFGAACVLGPIAARGRTLPVMLLVQFGLLFWFLFSPTRTAMALPTEAHRRAHEELATYVQQQPGDVFLPGHGNVTARAGKPASAHGQAIFDLLQVLPRNARGIDLAAIRNPQNLPAMAREALISFRDGMDRAITQKRYSAIVLDSLLVPSFAEMFGDLAVHYRRRPQSVVTEPTALRPLVGFDAHSPHAFEAR